MWAIKNEDVEVQIRTRPRGGYSTITQVAIKIMATGEILYIKGTRQACRSAIFCNTTYQHTALSLMNTFAFPCCYTQRYYKHDQLIPRRVLTVWERT